MEHILNKFIKHIFLSFIFSSPEFFSKKWYSVFQDWILYLNEYPNRKRWAF